MMKINRNTVWCELFVNSFVKYGVKHVVISPGSRNTPLTLAFAKNKKIKKYVLVDERQAGFFALGIAKSSNAPVVLVSTSGTAVGEYFPAVIEAYYQRTPLIICTADRPPVLHNCGANQTINQENIFRNNISWHSDLGLPSLSLKRLKQLIQITRQAVDNSIINNRGPVHLNFPFDKPFEPNSFTDEIDEITYEKILELHKTTDIIKLHKKTINAKIITAISNKICNTENGLIVAGPIEHNNEFGSFLDWLSGITGYPIVADGCSQIRFGNFSPKVITTYDSFLRNVQTRNDLKPGIILHFGRTATSKVLDEFEANNETEKYVINEYGDVFDTGKNAKAIINEYPVVFIAKLIKVLNKNKINRNRSRYPGKFFNLENKFNSRKQIQLKKEKSINSIALIDSCISLLPAGSNIYLSNSMPVRDFDSFSGISQKQFKIYFNRGASGIDGIIASAIGVSASQNKPTLLLIGDLAFQHDLSSLLLSQFVNSPLIIVLINNNGGGIFYNLPISKYGKLFKEYFVTPQNRDFASLVKGFGIKYYQTISVAEFDKRLIGCLKKNEVSVIEIKVDENESINLRKKIRAGI